MERRRQGPGGPRPLGVEVAVSRGSGETDDELVDEVSKLVFEAIERDADGGPWLGRVMLYNDNATKKSEQLVETIELRVDDESATPNREFETTALIATLGKFMDGVCKQVVAILAATAGERASVAELVGRVAKHDGSTSKAQAKYEHKARREEQQTERERIHEIGKTARAKRRWENMADIADRYHDVADKWSDVLIDHVKSQKTAKAPTLAQVNDVFAGEGYDALRACAAEMVCTPTKSVRMQLAEEFRRLCTALTEEQQNLLKLRAVQVLGSPQAAKDAFAWLSKPRTPPGA